MEYNSEVQFWPNCTLLEYLHYLLLSLHYILEVNYPFYFLTPLHVLDNFGYFAGYIAALQPKKCFFFFQMYVYYWQSDEQKRHLNLQKRWISIIRQDDNLLIHIIQYVLYTQVDICIIFFF